MTGMIRDLQANKEIMAAATLQGFLTATDLADWLVQNLDMPFRQAHHVTGRVVRLAEEKKCGLDELSLPELQSIEPRLTSKIYQTLDATRAVESRTSLGGTAPKLVKAQVVRWKKALAKG